MRRFPAANEKPLLWMGSSKRDLLMFPGWVIGEVGWALEMAQFGGRHPAAKPWKGAGPRVLKSPTGIKTARLDIEMVHRRLAAAEVDYEAHYGQA